MSCRVAMLRMQADGLLELPPPRHPRPGIRIGTTARTAPGPLIDRPVHALPELHLKPVQRTPSGLWNAFIHRYHYLGYTPLPGAQQRYFAYSGAIPLALLGFGAAATRAMTQACLEQLGTVKPPPAVASLSEHFSTLR